jgi:transcriptional regulator with XRE-family HTH domain
MKAEMTQTELADFTDLSKRYIQKIEHGEANVTVEVVEKLVTIFKCGWQEIIGEIEKFDPVLGKARAPSPAVSLRCLQLLFHLACEVVTSIFRYQESLFVE